MLILTENAAAGSVHSLSSSAVSGAASNPNRNRAQDSYSNWKKMSPVLNSNPPIRSPLNPGGEGQSAMKQNRRRVNSSGQLTSLGEPSPVVRMRRAITPNPALAYREAGRISSDSDAGVENPPFTNHYFKQYSGGDQLSPTFLRQANTPSSLGGASRGEFPASPPSTTTSSSPTRSSVNPKLNHPDQGGDRDVIGSKGSLDDDFKKGNLKKSKFGKSRLSKMALWVSPKRK